MPHNASLEKRQVRCIVAFGSTFQFTELVGREGAINMDIYNKLRIYDIDSSYHLEFDRNGYLGKCIENKTLLHVGCSDFPITQQRINEKNLLHQKLEELARSITGIDLSEEGINILIKHGFKNVFRMDAENLELCNKFDVIVAGDVMEHLNNPGLFLQGAIPLLNPGGEIIIGVPSALTLNNIKPWFFGWEQVHVDHTFYFSPKTLSALCARFDLLPTKLIFTVQPAGPYESTAYVFARKMVLKLCNTMAPSIIMHFKKAEDVDKTVYFDWK